MDYLGAEDNEYVRAVTRKILCAAVCRVMTVSYTHLDPPSYTLEEVRAVLSKKSAEGHGAQIRELLGKYGHNRLSDIDPNDYPALLADAEVL